VVIEVDADIVKYFGNQKYYNGFVGEEVLGSKVRMTFLSGSLTALPAGLCCLARGKNY
jgi:hypothetical protein